MNEDRQCQGNQKSEYNGRQVRPEGHRQPTVLFVPGHCRVVYKVSSSRVQKNMVAEVSPSRVMEHDAQRKLTSIVEFFPNDVSCLVTSKFATITTTRVH
jgi:hypothetical protein